MAECTSSESNHQSLDKITTEAGEELPVNWASGFGPFDRAPEAGEEYRVGGFHPVHIGDRFGENDRYRVIHKLGNGGFGTVWLCRDTEAHKYVGLKIVAAEESSEDCSELRLLKLKNIDFSQVGGDKIALPQDHFMIDGPNGSHLCLVLPFLGPSVTTIWDRRSDPRIIARKIALQMTQGLAFLHRNGICHGDFRPSNVLLRLSNFDDLSEEQLIEILSKPVMDPVHLVPGERAEREVPKYLVRPIDLDGIDRRYITDQICIIDFGESYEPSRPLESLGIPLGYRPPEVIFENQIGPACDIWALACSLYEIRVGSPLFEMFPEDEKDIVNQMVELFGALPEPWEEASRERNGACEEECDSDSSGSDKPPFVKGQTMRVYLREAYKLLILDTGEVIRVTIPEDEIEALVDLLDKMLGYDPEKRIPDLGQRNKALVCTRLVSHVDSLASELGGLMKSRIDRTFAEERFPSLYSPRLKRKIGFPSHNRISALRSPSALEEVDFEMSLDVEEQAALSRRLKKACVIMDIDDPEIQAEPNAISERGESTRSSGNLESNDCAEVAPNSQTYAKPKEDSAVRGKRKHQDGDERAISPSKRPKPTPPMSPPKKPKIAETKGETRKQKLPDLKPEKQLARRFLDMLGREIKLPTDHSIIGKIKSAQRKYLSVPLLEDPIGWSSPPRQGSKKSRPFLIFEDPEGSAHLRTSPKNSSGSTTPDDHDKENFHEVTESDLAAMDAETSAAQNGRAGSVVSDNASEATTEISPGNDTRGSSPAGPLQIPGIAFLFTAGPIQVRLPQHNPSLAPRVVEHSPTESPRFLLPAHRIRRRRPRPRAADFF
ncbi:hypothetical protein FQN54_006114 [Arachnomyces sp. PD_36]|nr:hypothetical protein FQN54_006114 [Arachnomyces sp. PD_36]